MCVYACGEISQFVAVLLSQLADFLLSSPFSTDSEAESAPEVGRLRRRGSGGEEAAVQRAEIVDNRTVQRDGGGVHQSRRGVPDRRLLRLPELQYPQLREGNRGGDPPQGRRHHQRRAREGRVRAVSEARDRRRLRHGSGADTRSDPRLRR